MLILLATSMVIRSVPMIAIFIDPIVVLSVFIRVLRFVFFWLLFVWLFTDESRLLLVFVLLVLFLLLIF